MSDPKGREVVFRSDPLNEGGIIAGLLCGGPRADAFRARMVRDHQPDSFRVPEYATIFRAVRESVLRKLPPDPVTLNRLANGEIDLTLMTELMASRPDLPDDASLGDMMAALTWDRAKYVAVTGPIESLLASIQKNEGPDTVRGHARAVAQCFDGWGDRRHLHDPETLVREQMADIRQRQAGLASYTFGLEGLDYYEERAAGEEREKRIVVGTAPGLVTILTGSSSSGKSTVAGRFALGMARAGRRVLYCAWEPTGGMTLELIACMLLNMSRKRLYKKNELTEEELAKLEAAMTAIGSGRKAWNGGQVKFLANPFGRGTTSGKESNERNLDIIQGYIADSGCDVVIFDLWERCLVHDEPHEEKRALFRQQAMLEEMGVHGILLAQQRKDMQAERPTMSGIKGSGGWYEIGDNVLGVYRPYLAKPVPDNVLEVTILKQRQGVAPLAVELDWDADRGMISGGRSIEYERPGFQNGVSTGGGIDAFMTTPKPKGQGQPRGRR